jgi:hypothetical protein
MGLGGKAAQKVLDELASRASKGDVLAGDFASRMQRAADQNYMQTYHGTTRDIPESGFQMGGYAEADLGQGIYSTTSPYDASFNYADPQTSQDLIGKIGRRAEELEGLEDLDYDVALQQARSELVGNPQVHPTMVRTDNPVRIGGDKETTFDLVPEFDTESTWDDAVERMQDEYGDELTDGSMDADEIKELTMEKAREVAEEWDYVSEPKLIDSLRNVAHRFEDADIDRAIADVYETFPDGEASAEELIDVLKGSEGIQYATSGDTGDLASGELIRHFFEDAGHDAIIDATPNKKWGSESGRPNFMPELEGTEHVIAFNPNQMRSTSAMFDPAKKSSANMLGSADPRLLAGISASGVIGTGIANALYTPEQNQVYADTLRKTPSG